MIKLPPVGSLVRVRCTPEMRAFSLRCQHSERLEKISPGDMALVAAHYGRDNAVGCTLKFLSGLVTDFCHDWLDEARARARCMGEITWLVDVVETPDD